ncbi:MAG: secondary thiamine-phosphate synthase enzyme YjbQ [Candidatus Aminicenantes bacterium]|nr:secondary thiamine-phosphate synthase enzyme YjbQ [Candidatus Aminicenantes bacterium]MCK5004099.1 secondary thiamine-phosphate synthase enzyme YjbQ [Candidatus Aminicenantes bacterium]
MIFSEYVNINTGGKNEIVDITGDVRSILKNSGVSAGSILVFVPGATGAVTTIEFEPGLVRDFPELMERLIPENITYLHNETWHDGNGHSHLRASLIGPSLTIPVIDAEPVLGTWQQIIFLEFDNKPHSRKIVVQVSGE